MSLKDSSVSPILKWVGGKRQLLDVIRPLVPDYSTYYEPFVGGGALLFDLQPQKAVINDSNEELINVYNVIRDYPDLLILALQRHKEKNCKDYYYKVRSLDRDTDEYMQMSNVERAARIIYLNKTCYNGLFRVNNAGEFNSPWGKYKNPNIINETTIRAINKYFNRVQIIIKCEDYKKAFTDMKQGDFVYLDPPYMPISSTSYFTGYTAEGFGEEAQIELHELCASLDKKGIKFLLSNSDCDFIRELYEGFIINTVTAKRAINSKAEKRGDVQEVLIRNYECN